MANSFLFFVLPLAAAKTRTQTVLSAILWGTVCIKCRLCRLHYRKEVRIEVTSGHFETCGEMKKKCEWRPKENAEVGKFYRLVPFSRIDIYMCVSVCVSVFILLEKQ